MEPGTRPTPRTYCGVFMVTLATLMYEILLTRIFSVTMWYHFAFVAISIAMFGMTVGSLLVFLVPRYFSRDTVMARLATFGAAFPVLIVLSFLTQLSIPFVVHPSVVAAYGIVFSYAVISVPFVASGVCVSLALTKLTGRVSQLYAADLAGAGVGCLLLAATLRFTDGPTAVLVVACLAGIGGVMFALDGGSARLMRAAVGTTALLALAAGVHTVLVSHQFPVLRILYAKGSFESRPLYERWNSYSRVRVTGDADARTRPYERTLSPAFPADRTVRLLQMAIDVNASTEMTAFSGDLSAVEHLRFDVTNIGHHVRPGGDVLVVGSGGGRDVLAALAFDAKSVTAVEINRDIIETVNRRFGDFTGHLDRNPRVRFVNDEARSFIARQTGRFDFIQISLIDTWAATAAGAFVLSENSLYTMEAWHLFLAHLSDRGLLSVSRWYEEARPWEIYRTVTLATAALKEHGITDPRRHVVVVRTRPIGDGNPVGVGTVLVSRVPFTDADLDRLDAATSAMRFETMLSPRVALDRTLERVSSGSDQRAFLDSYPVNLNPPTDDSPFFFQMLRPRDMFSLDLLNAGKSKPNMVAVFVLGALLCTVIGLSLLCIVVPLGVVGDRSTLGGAGDLLVYFAAIGMGFMLVETSQMQRLIIVLGHPTYGLTVVLFALLLSSGIGSYLTASVGAQNVGRSGRFRLLLLLVVLVATGLATPFMVRSFEAASTPVRIAVAALVLFPAGMLMGMAFPLGMKLASRRAEALNPWLWGVNGAFSVCASVLAIVIALGIAISAAYWTGCAAYAVAVAAFVRANRAKAPATAEHAVASGM